MSTCVINLNRCNQKCVFCMVSERNRNAPDMTYAMVARQITQARRSGATHIDFYGGEPTVFPFLKKAVELANKYGLRASLATNAVKFSSIEYTDEFFDGISLDAIRISLHSLKPAVHDRITGCRGSLKKTIQGIKNILKHNKRVRVNVVINALNYKELPSIVRYLHKIGVNRIKLSGIVWGGDAPANPWLAVTSDKFYNYYQKAVKLARGFKFRYIESEKLPRCVIAPEHSKVVHYIKEDNIGFAKTAQCSDCKLLNDCNGFGRHDLNIKTIEFLKRGGICLSRNISRR